ncbi:putative suppression of tumorigenicity [Hibiscus syriacus]|uniref:Suppression of tumorigenicity n=1 Tax=Hibiscus syriacus TaxID=106335 RepID=A0A6A2YR64_HIBSY|nr:putative suppression of tumorigenicity [Hibiscus syriacus]
MIIRQSVFSSKVDVAEKKPETRNIQEAELFLRETSSLNYEEARALLGRIEYQKGNIEAALHVFEGIDIAGITPKMKLTLAKRVDRRNRRSNDHASPPICTIILDIVESSLPEGFPENFDADCKLQETIIKAVELLPELWKFGDSPHEAILSYRRALLHQWNLDAETTARIQKQFAIFLLYCGSEASPTNLFSQMDKSDGIHQFWIICHLLSPCVGRVDLKALANQIEELLPGVINRKERYKYLALCYYGAGEGLVSLNIVRKLLHGSEDPHCVPALLMASRICGEKPNLAEEGINFAHRALESLDDECIELEGTCNLLLGVSQSTHSKSASSESERISRQSEALQSLESAWKIMRMKDPNVLSHLSLENAEGRKLEVALYYAKLLLKLEGVSNIKVWLFARILSAQKRFVDGETVLNVALYQTGKWDQGELLCTKAKLQIAEGQFKSAIETYSQLLAVVQVQSKSFGFGKRLHKVRCLVLPIDLLSTYNFMISIILEESEKVLLLSWLQMHPFFK